MMIARLMLLLE